MFRFASHIDNLNGAKPVTIKSKGKVRSYEVHMYVTCNLQDVVPLWTGILLFADELYIPVV